MNFSKWSTAAAVSVVSWVQAAADFSDSAKTSQQDREETFKSEISSQRIRGYIHDMTARPKYPGAPFAESLALQTLARFKEFDAASSPSQSSATDGGGVPGRIWL